MTQYAKLTDDLIIFPSSADFPGVPNWQDNDFRLRAKSFFPLHGEPEERLGVTSNPIKGVLHEQTKKVTRSIQVEVPDYEEDPETHERKQTGSHMEWQEKEVEVNDNYIEVTEWEYIPIPEPEPIPEPDTTARDTAEKQIVAAIIMLARKYGAEAEIASMTDITIPALQELALKYNVSQSDMAETLGIITLSKWQLEAVENMLWSDCWNGIKSRFRQWMLEINI